MRYLLLTLGLTISMWHHGNAQKVSISIFNELELQTVLVTPVSGQYSLIMGNQEFILFPNQIVYISRSNDSIKVRDMASNLGTWKRVSLVGLTQDDVIRVSPIVPSSPARIYDDNLSFYVDFNRVMALNLVEKQKYVAGVVCAESGPNAHEEFYKAQSLLAYTYAIGHLERHAGEGFNLCDGVHCQAYKGKSTRNPAILKAAEETLGYVVVDSTNKPIIGAFHANCGGQTAASEGVWLRPHPYLVSVTDTHCRNQPGSQWEVRIPIGEWRSFLDSKGFVTTQLSDAQLEVASRDREYYYVVDNQRIRKTEIRSHFRLRSAFFNVEVASGNIRLRGRGYGHGVGMCQEGAMQMARRGDDYSTILSHYFSGVRVVRLDSLPEICPCDEPSHYEE